MRFYITLRILHRMPQSLTKACDGMSYLKKTLAHFVKQVTVGHNSRTRLGGYASKQRT